MTITRRQLLKSATAAGLVARTWRAPSYGGLVVGGRLV